MRASSSPPRIVRGAAVACLATAVILPAWTTWAAKPDAATRSPRAAKRSEKPKREQPIRLPAAVLTAPTGPVMDVAAIDRNRGGEVAQAAAAIDRLLGAHWQAHGVEPAERLTDPQFVRRMYLELAGRIPSFDETARFLESKSESKRTDLVDDLLESPDYVSHFYNFWADILRLCERPQKDLFFEPYLDWVKRSIATNVPYDRWVREMLTADGKVWENPATGYQLRDKGMPLPYVDNTVRVFLGTQIGCAQCHDHPFDKWTQHEFYELAAFTSGTRMRLAGLPPGKQPGQSKEEAKAAAREARKANTEALKQVREITQEVQTRVKARKVDNGMRFFVGANLTSVNHHDAKLLLPHDYKYDDAKPLEAVSPQVLWGEIPGSAAGLDGRGKFAAWLTARDNRQFARTIANRLWRKVMGVGLVEPVDDFREDNPASNPELLEHLTDLVLALDFDMREYVRVLVSTDGYQRRAVLHDATAAEPFHFAGPALKRMTAEQLWDSILTLVARNEWAFQRPAAPAYGKLADIDLTAPGMSYEKVEKAYDAFNDAYGINRYRVRLQKQYGYQGQVLVRASELPAPLPLGHFLRQFGQSDRESIEGARTVATVPQILAMFNGSITHSMLERGSVIYDEVLEHDPRQAVDVIFLSILSHRPSAEDRSFAIQEIRSAESPAAGCGNLIWALLNTREFIFIQ
ncbi:MAG: hypothetical protein RLZZ111_163 [Planctomycetota bacterium]|jgi:hypothetical protein